MQILILLYSCSTAADCAAQKPTAAAQKPATESTSQDDAELADGGDLNTEADRAEEGQPEFGFDHPNIKNWLLLGPIARSAVPDDPVLTLGEPQEGKKVDFGSGVVRSWKPWKTQGNAIDLATFCKQERRGSEYCVVYAAVQLVSDQPDRRMFVAMDDGAKAWVDGELRVRDVSAGWISKFEHAVQLDFSKKKKQWLLVEVHNYVNGFQLMVTQGNTIRGEVQYSDSNAGVPNFRFAIRCGGTTLSVVTNGQGQFVVNGAQGDKEVEVQLEDSQRIPLEEVGPSSYRLEEVVRLPTLREVQSDPIEELDNGNYSCFSELPDGRLLLFECIQKKFHIFAGGPATEVVEPIFGQLDNSVCRDIHVASNGEYWLATDAAVYCIQGDRIQSWSNDLIGGKVNRLHLGSHACWVGHTDGLTLIDFKTGSVNRKCNPGLSNVLGFATYQDETLVVYKRRKVDDQLVNRRQFAAYDGKSWRYIDFPKSQVGAPLSVICSQAHKIVYVACEGGILAYRMNQDQWKLVCLAPNSESRQMCQLRGDRFLAVSADRTAIVFFNGRLIAQSQLKFAVQPHVRLQQLFTGEAAIASKTNGILRLRMPPARRLNSIGLDSTGTGDVRLSSRGTNLLISPSNTPSYQGNLRRGFQSVKPKSATPSRVSEMRLPEPGRMLLGPGFLLAVPYLSSLEDGDRPDPSPPLRYYANGRIEKCERPIHPMDACGYHCAMTDSFDRFLLGTTAGLWELQGVTFRLSHLFPGQPVPKVAITAICQTDDAYWLGADDNRLFRCTATGIEEVRLDIPKGQSARTTAIAAFNGKIFVGTSDGLFELNASLCKVVRTATPLSRMIISDLLVSENGERLWIATLYRGLFQLHRNGAVTEVGDLFGGSPPLITSIENFQKQLWIGSSSGVFHRRPTSIAPRLFVSQISVGNKQISGRSTDGLLLDSAENVAATESEVSVRTTDPVAVTLTSLDDDPNRLFEYRVDDGPWIVAGSSRRALQVPLRFQSEGAHDVEFRCTDSDANYSAIARTHFHSFIPFWSRPIVHAATLAMLLSLGTGLIAVALIHWHSQVAARRAAEQATQARDALMERVCHDLRSPIGVVSVCTDVLSHPNSDRKSMIELLGKSVESMQHLSNQLLLFCRSEQIRESHPQPLDIARFLDQLERATLLTLGTVNVKFRTVIASDVPATLQMDDNLLREVLNNILSNAYRHTESGEISLTCDRQPEGGIRFRVTDTGCGMKQQDLANVFTATFRKKRIAGSDWARNDQNMGLGLTICHNLMKAMGGSISIDSEWSKGTEITLLFPASVEKVLPVEPTANPDRTRKILVIDDVESVRNSLSSLLISKGHNVMTCDEMLSIEEVRKFQPDIVITDLGMPVTSGFDVAKDIRKQLGGATLIVGMTESADLLSRAQKEPSFDQVMDKTRLSSQEGIEQLLAL